MKIKLLSITSIFMLCFFAQPILAQNPSVNSNKQAYTTETADVRSSPTKKNNSAISEAEHLTKDSASITINIFVMVVTLLTLLFLIRVLLWLFHRNNQILIDPFENQTGNDHYNGKTLVNLLLEELRRIRRIHSSSLLKNYPNQLDQLILLGAKPEFLLIPDFAKAETENFNQAFANLGILEVGGTKIPMGGMLCSLKEMLCGNQRKVFTGSLLKEGEDFLLVARLEDKNSFAWKIQEQGQKNQEKSELEIVLLIMRDLSFKIFKDLSEEITAKSWEGFKFYTEALIDYSFYLKSRNVDLLSHVEENCKKAVNIEPKYQNPLELLCTIGFIYLEHEKYEKAKNIFNEYHNLYPNNPYVLTGYSSSLWHSQHLDQSILDLPFYFNKNSSERKKILQEIEEMNDNLDKALNQNIKHPWLYAHKGSVSALLDKPNQALKFLTKAIQDYPQYARAYITRGSVYLQIRNYEKALKDANNAINYCADDYRSCLYQAIALRGEIYRRQGDLYKAEKDFDEAYKINSTCWLLLAQRGLLYREQALNNNNNKDCYDKAIKEFKQALKPFKLEPEEECVYCDLGITYALLGEFDEAINNFNKAINQSNNCNNTRGWYYYNRALAYYKINKKLEAKSDIYTAIEIADKHKDSSDKNLICKSWRNSFNLGLYYLASLSFQCTAEENADLFEKYYLWAGNHADQIAIRIAIKDLNQFLKIYGESSIAKEQIKKLENKLNRFSLRNNVIDPCCKWINHENLLIARIFYNCQMTWDKYWDNPIKFLRNVHLTNKKNNVKLDFEI